jgi:hypothetical protein
MYSDHDYEIIATYNNTLDHNIDSMAVMYLYLRDVSVNIPQSRRGI